MDFHDLASRDCGQSPDRAIGQAQRQDSSASGQPPAQFRCLPSQFQLVATTNPCPCGNFGAPAAHLHLAHSCASRVTGRLSGPLLDRAADFPVSSTRPASTTGPSMRRRSPRWLRPGERGPGELFEGEAEVGLAPVGEHRRADADLTARHHRAILRPALPHSTARKSSSATVGKAPRGANNLTSG
jgi:hypothetical protein